MNRSQLVKCVAAQTGLDNRTVDTALKGFTDVVTAVNSKGEPVSISGFAKFARVDRAARIGRNPQTGAPVNIPAKRVARVTALKAFKDAVLTPSLAPKLVKGVWPYEAPVKAAAPARPAAAKKAPAKKAPVRKAPAAKKAPAKKAPAKKAPAKKAARR